MIVHLLLLGVILMLFLLTRVDSIQRNNLVLLISFVLIWLYAALRFDYGPDYETYLQIFKFLKSGFDHEEIERGYALFLQLFPSYTSMIIVTSTMMSITFYRVFKSYVDEHYYWIAMMFLFLDMNLLLYNFVAMRTGICVYLFIIAFHYLFNRKPIQYFALIVFASFFHLSALILVPFYFITDKELSNRASNLFIILSVVFAVFSYSHSITLLKTIASIGFFDRYAALYFNDLETVGVTIGNLIITGLFLLISILAVQSLSKEEKSVNRVILKLTYLYAIISLLKFGMLARILMFFAPFYVVGLILIMTHLKRRITKIGFISYVLSYCVFIIITNFQKDWSETFHVYKTILTQNPIP